MRCDEARAGLWPPERPRLAGDEIVAAREHVEGCAACRDYLRQDRRLLEAYGRLAAGEAPTEVRERVFDALARARAGRASEGKGVAGTVAGTGAGAGAGPGSGLSPGGRWLVAGGVAVAALTAALLPVLPGSSPAPAEVAPSGEVFVEDYLRRAVGEDHVRTTDPGEVRRFLARELGVRLTPLQAEGLVMEGAEICLLEGRRGAMIVYKKDGVRISHYLVPRSGTTPRKPELSARAAPGEGAMPVVTWSTGSVEEALVGEVSPRELLELASRAGAS